MKNMRQYLIHFQVSTDSELCKDYAIVKAVSENDAIVKLKAYILSTGYENYVHRVFSMKEFNDYVFSGRFRPMRAFGRSDD